MPITSLEDLREHRRLFYILQSLGHTFSENRFFIIIDVSGGSVENRVLIAAVERREVQLEPAVDVIQTRF
jgi:hypothetical protein